MDELQKHIYLKSPFSQNTNAANEHDLTDYAKLRRTNDAPAYGVRNACIFSLLFFDSNFKWIKARQC